MAAASASYGLWGVGSLSFTAITVRCRWVKAAGGKVDAAEGVEVSPTMSYAGEGLEALCCGCTFEQPHSSVLQVHFVGNL